MLVESVKVDMESTLVVAERLVPVLEELRRLEPLFHAANTGATPQNFEELVAPEFWEVGASGRRYSREFALSVLKERQRLPAEEEWETNQFHLTEIAEDVYLLTYTLVQLGRITRRATLWRQSAGRWQAIYHQGTVMLTIRPMRHTDLPSVLEIQALCYTELIPESEESLRAKLSASPSTCHVACQQDGVIGYLISSPGRFESPPELNAASHDLPPDPDSLYLHDLAVAPAARKSGAGRALVEKFIAQTRSLSFGHASLIAVQGSQPYWQRYGFQPVRQTAALKTKLSSYGGNVEYMERTIESA